MMKRQNVSSNEDELSRKRSLPLAVMGSAVNEENDNVLFFPKASSAVTPMRSVDITPNDNRPSLISCCSAESLYPAVCSGRFSLSTQQVDIIKLARSPSEALAPQRIRVTASAGSGKTTALCELADMLASKGHSKIKYIAFNKVTALNARLLIPSCETIHACAMSLLDCDALHLIADEKELDAVIESHVGSEIDIFLNYSMKGENVSPAIRSRIKQRMIFFVRKTLCCNFMQSDNAENFDPLDSKSVYYPAILYHSGEKEKDLPKSFLSRNLNCVKSFYCRVVKQIWQLFKRGSDNSKPKFATFDSYVKRCQLMNLAMDCSVLLVDESQDLNGCQLRWVDSQNVDIFFSGDIMQQIYTFRGAIAKFILSLKNTIDMPLVESWRFGTAIACVANTILFAKSHSPQSLGEHDYRVIGRGGPGEVTTRNLALEVGSENETRKPVAVLALTNISLMKFALDLLLQSDAPCNLMFALQGAGESSGLKRWHIIRKDLQSFFNVYLASLDGNSAELNIAPWKNESSVTWADVVKDVQALELRQWLLTISLIMEYGEETMKKFAIFREKVLDRSVAAADADIILSTVHSAKGLEWDRVLVLDDMVDLARLQAVGGDCGLVSFSPASRQPRPCSPSIKPSFDYKKYGDDINIWYVAVTRAKKVLSVPPKFIALVTGLSESTPVLSSRVERADDTVAIFSQELVNDMNPAVVSPAQLNISSNQSVSIPSSPIKSSNRLFGRECSPADKDLIYNELYIPWCDEQRLPTQGGGLVIDGKSYC